MLDLCYNCSSCHIGACPRNLHQCEICYAWGHQYIFCPRGVTQRDPNYRYWALCHNCDMWHLPNVCETPYHDCAQCGHAGHLEIFCPVNPTDRMPHKHEQRRRLLAGAPPTTNHDYRQPFSGIIPQEHIARMKLDGVRQAFSMLDQGFHPNQVIMFMSGPPPPPGNIPMTPGSTPATFQLPGTVQHGVTQHAARARIPSNVPFQPAGHQISSPESADAKHVDEFGTYISMHHRFQQGDLARSIQQERPMDTVPMTENLSLTHGLPQLGQVQPSTQITTPMTPVAATQVQSTGLEPQSALAGLQDDGPETQATAIIERTEDVGPVKKAKQKKATKTKTDREDTPAGSTVKQGPRCAACIKSHKRCKHRAQQESPTPQPLSDPSFATPSAPANCLPVSGAPEGYVQAPPTLPDHSFTLPAENTTVPPPVEKKAATTKRKR